MTDFGTDFSCVADCADDFGLATGRTVVAQAIARRFMTPRGRLIGDANYGFDLTGYVNDDLSSADLSRIASGCEAEAVKDERVISASVTVTLSVAGLLLVTCVLDTAAGPFTLVLSVTAVTVEVLKVVT